MPRSKGKGYLFAHISTEYSCTLEIITVPAIDHLGLRKYPLRLYASDKVATPHYTCPTRSHGGSSKNNVLNEPDWAGITRSDQCPRLHGQARGDKGRRDPAPAPA